MLEIRCGYRGEGWPRGGRAMDGFAMERSFAGRALLLGKALVGSPFVANASALS